MLNVRINTPEAPKLSPKITVVGVGGAGGNAVNNMLDSNLGGCNFVVCNTDAQALENSVCENKIQLGSNVTGGLGAGARPEVGRRAAEESISEVMSRIEDSNMVFITAGMGGGTGTGAAPIIAQACRDRGILTVGVVTKPFHFEGTYRMKMAEGGIEQMQDYVDTLIVIPNQNLFIVANEKTTFSEAFGMADSVLQSAVRGVTDLMVLPGIVNLDFEDIRSAMSEMGKAMMGTGEAEGENRAKEAAEAAINNPLLDDVTMKGAKGVIINVTGGEDLTLFDIDEACNRIGEEVAPDANIIFGSAVDNNMTGRMRVSVVATGIDAEKEEEEDTRRSRFTRINRVRTESAVAEEEISEDNTESEETTFSQPQTSPSGFRPRPSVFETPARPTLPARATIDRNVRENQESQENAPETAREIPSPSVPSPTLRGRTHEGSFIPPKPAIPEPQAPRSNLYGGGHPFNHSVPSTSETEYEQHSAPEKPAVSKGYGFTPPVTNKPSFGQSSLEGKRTPSLFERITGRREEMREQREEYSYDQEMPEISAGKPQETPASDEAPETGLQAPQRVQDTPSQGRLNIDTPASTAKKSDEDTLDIPAFLRRQAN
jgi:cell division protein FtsZ